MSSKKIRELKRMEGLTSLGGIFKEAIEKELLEATSERAFNLGTKYADDDMGSVTAVEIAEEVIDMRNMIPKSLHENPDFSIEDFTEWVMKHSVRIAKLADETPILGNWHRVKLDYDYRKAVDRMTWLEKRICHLIFETNIGRTTNIREFVDTDEFEGEVKNLSHMMEVIRARFDHCEEPWSNFIKEVVDQLSKTEEEQKKRGE